MALRALLLALCAVIVLASSAGASAGHGSIYVTTLPPGATVWLDGTYMGETPLFIDQLDSGRHFITLTRSGWQPQSAPADVTIGRVTTVSAVLVATNPVSRPNQNRAKGTLSIRDANGAKVYLDGEALGTPYENQAVAAGDHILLVQRGSNRQTTSVRIYPDVTTTVSLTPSRQSSVPGGSDDVLAPLTDYVPANDFTVSGDEITIHHDDIELECTIGSRNYTFNGKAGTLDVAPAMVANKPYLPLSLLNRIAGPAKSGGH